MGKKKISINVVSGGADWEEFLEGCVDVKVFHHSWFADAHCGPVEYIQILKGQEPLAAAVIPLDCDGNAADFGGLVYGGAVFHKRVFEASPAHASATRFEILEEFAAWLMDRFEQGYISFSPSIDDMRPFQWYRYGLDGPHYGLRIRYTGIVEQQSFSHDSFSQSRRQECRLAERENVEVRNDVEPKTAIELIKESLTRQGESAESDIVSSIEERCQRVCAKGGRIYGAVADGEVTSVMVMADSDLESIYLYGGQSSGGRRNGAGSLLMAKALEAEFKMGKHRVDLEGVNSPKRGYFKMAFGAQLKPYFAVSWNKSAK